MYDEGRPSSADGSLGHGLPETGTDPSEHQERGPEDVERIFGRLGPDGYVSQMVHDESMPPKEFREETASNGAVESSCEYVYGDADITSLKVQVDQYRNPKRAKGEWASIAYLGTGKESKKLAKDTYGDGFGFVVELARENERNMGGDPVAGARKPLLYVAGRQSFMSYGSNVVVTLGHGRSVEAFIDPSATPWPTSSTCSTAPRRRGGRALRHGILHRRALPAPPGRSVPQGDYDFGSPSAARYRKAVDVVVANLQALPAELEADPQ